jgi:hypothetical protein
MTFHKKRLLFYVSLFFYLILYFIYFNQKTVEKTLKISQSKLKTIYLVQQNSENKLFFVDFSNKFFIACNLDT